MSWRSWIIRLAATLSVTLPLLAPLSGEADEAAPEGKTLSPYFLVGSGDPAIDRLPLKATTVDVKVAGIIADVHVTQRYRNEGTRPIEARYVFPASTRAAVYAMTMRIGARRLDARIREKQQARAEYEAAKHEGKSASLLEQHRPNVFQMNVANILPGDEIAVELHYTETLLPTDGKYQFVFPTVVGPRYNGSPANGSGTAEPWVAQPTLLSGAEPKASFAIRVALESPIPIKEIVSTSHPISTDWRDAKHAIASLDPAKAHANKDFILDYRLAGKSIESGVLLSRAADENFFLAMIEPPQRPSVSEIVPREYIFIVDISGSMHGFPLETSKRLLRKLVGSLKASDTFNVLLFAGDNSILAPASLAATPDNIEQAIDVINRQRGGGSTELIPAMKRALGLPRDDTRARSFVLVTDGYVTVEKDAFELVRNNLGRANIFAFGIGSAVNRHLIEGLARAGQGEAFVVTRSEHAEAEAERFRQYIEAPVWTHLKLRIDGMDAYDIDPPSLPDLFAARPVIVMGKWRGTAKGSISIDGHSGSGRSERQVTIDGETASSEAGALRYLWARKRIATLADNARIGQGESAVAQEVTALGLKYSLLTDYTSFVAVDRIVRNAGGDGPSVDQPQAMPEGVSDLALGGEVPSTPEPEFYALVALAGGLGAWLRRRQQQRQAGHA